MATTSLTSPGMSPLPSPMLVPQSPRSTSNPTASTSNHITNTNSTNYDSDPLAATLNFVPSSSSSSNKLLPSTSNISLLSLSFSNAEPDQFGNTMDILQEEQDSTNTLGRHQSQLQQQQWLKSTPSSYSTNQYMSAAQQRRVGHYINSMGTGSRPGSRRGSTVNLMSSSPGNPTSFVGSQQMPPTGSYMGAPTSGQAIPQTPRSRRPSYSQYSMSPMYFSPSSSNGTNSINGMLIPDSPNLGPISLRNSPTSLLLNQTPPFGMRTGSSLSRTNSSTSLYQQHQQNLFHQYLQQQQLLQPQPSKDQPLPFASEHVSIFNVLENSAAPPKQSGISKTFSQQGHKSILAPNISNTTPSDIDNSSSIEVPTNSNNMSNISTNLSRDPPPLRSLQDDQVLQDRETKSEQTKGFQNKNKTTGNNIDKDGGTSSKNLNERELREKQKVSKTAAAITAALNSEILKNKEHDEKERHFFTLNQSKPTDTTTNGIIGTENDQRKSSVFSDEEEGNETSGLSSSAHCEDLPSYLQGKVLGASSTPIAIPASSNKKLARGHKNDIEKEKQDNKAQEVDDVEEENIASSTRNSNVPDRQSTGVSVSPSSSIQHASSASNMRALMSPTSARYRQSQLSMSNLSAHFSSGLNLNAGLTASNGTSESYNTGTFGPNSSRLYQSHHVGQPQLMATAIDEDSDIISPLSSNVNGPVAAAGTLSLTPTTGSLSSLVLQPSTPDSPGLYPVSMTPFEAGLMTPMTLDPLSSRHASLASVDHFFHAGMTPLNTTIAQMNSTTGAMASPISPNVPANVSNIAAVSTAPITAAGTAAPRKFAPVGNQPSNLQQRLQGLNKSQETSQPEDNEKVLKVSNPLETLKRSSENK